MLRQKKAQTLMEYTIVLGTVVLVALAMTPLLKRGTQGMIKVVADQLGVQKNSDQVYNLEEGGFLQSSITNSSAKTYKGIVDVVGNIEYLFEDRVYTNSLAIIDQGRMRNVKP